MDNHFCDSIIVSIINGTYFLLYDLITGSERERERERERESQSETETETEAERERRWFALLKGIHNYLFIRPLHNSITPQSPQVRGLAALLPR